MKRKQKILTRHGPNSAKKKKANVERELYPDDFNTSDSSELLHAQVSDVLGSWSMDRMAESPLQAGEAGRRRRRRISGDDDGAGASLWTGVPHWIGERSEMSDVSVCFHNSQSHKWKLSFVDFTELKFVFVLICLDEAHGVVRREEVWRCRYTWRANLCFFFWGGMLEN